MDFFEVQDFFKQAYPDKNITYEFDERCQRVQEIIFTDGLPNPIHHVECNKVKVNIEGLESQYVPIKPHRYNNSWMSVKNNINSRTDVFISEVTKKDLKELRDSGSPNLDKALEQLKAMTGLDKQKILKKLDD